MFPPDEPPEPPDYWADRWADIGEPEWWEEDVTIYNDYFQPMTMTGEDWFNATLSNSMEENLALYGIDTLDIIHNLEDMGLWDADDWDTWRDAYSETAG